MGEKAIVSSVWGSNSADAVQVSAEDLEDAADDLCQPAVLVVEDQENDGCFVKSVASALGHTRLIDAIDRGWLVIRHAGGERLELVAKNELLTFRRLSRIAALLDSDRWTPSDRTNNHVKAERLTALGISVHVLELREAENYVPSRILALIGKPAETSKKLEALKSLTPSQRGYYDMKFGFGPVASPPRIRAEQTELFSTIDMPTLLRLRGGFGRKVLAAMYENRARLKQSDLAALGVEQELEEMLMRIESLV
ncbi:hypothetical protein [Actinoplanes nipponensis]|uniref:hypothetical protein n=1 Tax=Actinoplanes nipponensis TaxID=135950 RepID=UPI0019422ECD|nr:hypothetical protein [Actinoplanes nipponensis]